MILKISTDEALDSYISRSYLLNRLGDWQSYGAGFDDNWGYSNRFLREIASLQGWEGCAGYNKLLHRHTHYPRFSFLKDRGDIYYSADEFQRDVANRNLTEFMKSPRVKFCVACVQEDFANNGYAYWRRSHQFFEVCAVHNLKLLAACQACDKPFSMRGKVFTLLWTGCECGKQVKDGFLQANEDPLELRVSTFFKRLNEFGFHLDTAQAVEAIASQFLRRGLSRNAWDGQIPHRYRDGFDLLVDALLAIPDHEQVCQRLKMVSPPTLVDLGMLIFDSFNDFVVSARFNPLENLAVTSTWPNLKPV